MEGGPQGHVVKKSVIAGTAGDDITKEIQDDITTRTQVQLLKQLVAMLENDLLDLHNKEIQVLVEKLAKLIGVMVSGLRLLPMRRSKSQARRHETRPH